MEDFNIDLLKIDTNDDANSFYNVTHLHPFSLTTNKANVKDIN